MYQVFEDFISIDEQAYIKSFVSTRINELNGNLQSYSSHEQMFIMEDGNFTDVLKRDNEPVLFFSIADDIGCNEILSNIAHKMQDVANVSYENPNTYFNWVISLCPNGTEVLAHLDPLSSELRKTKKIVRMNVIVQNAKRGGTFDLQSKDKKWITADIPERALMIFNASDTIHKISKNLSNVTRINFSIDAVVDK